MLTLAREASRRLFLLILITVLASCIALPTTPARVPSPPVATATLTPSAPSDQEIISRLNTALTNLSFNGSVLVARDGNVLLSKGYGEADREKKVPNTDKTKFRIASITKQFTAMAILILQARGKLDVQDGVCDYISTCPPAWQTITLHHLLTHTSGIPDYYSSPDWATYQATPMAPTDIIEHFIDKPLDFQPGEKWKYSNSGYTVLGNIIEQVSGTTYEAFIKENILVPLKMADTSYLENTQGLSIGYADANTTLPANFEDISGLYASGGLCSTVGDLYLWDQALYTDKLIPKDLSDKMLTSYTSIPHMDGFGYGYGWLIGEIANHRVVGHTGRIEGFTAVNMYYPDDRVTVIVLSNQWSENIFGVEIQLANIIFA